MNSSFFDQEYPNLAWFVKENHGWIELGRDDYSRSMIRILDPGGMIWEGKSSYKSVDAALRAAEEAIIRFRTENEV